MEWNDFSGLKDNNALEQYFGKDRSFTHGKYCHYTSLVAINGILGGKIWVSCVSRFNDECDKEQFGDSNEQKRYYAFCLSAGETENLPLWYLYSGVDGKGGRIRLTANKLKKIIDSATFTLHESTEDNKPQDDIVFSLDKNKDITIEVRDVLYQDIQTKVPTKSRIKYNTMVNYNLTNKEYEIFKNNHKGFHKDTIWFYEKETRILITLSQEIYDKLDSSKNYMVIMSFKIPNIGLHIDFAPAITGKNITEVRSNFLNIEAFKNTNFSKHAGKVEFNLCKKCKKINLYPNDPF